MRKFPSRDSRIASGIVSGAALAALTFFTGSASAQYYPRNGDQFYERYERYPRRGDTYERRPSRKVLGYPFDRRSGEPRVHHPRRERAEPKVDVTKLWDKTAKGPYQIVVSIASQRIYLYGADGLIGESKVSTGMRGHSTPTGVFSVIEKDYFHRSNIYSGAPMPLMQRITWSGIALHEGVLPGYPASHGCIRMTASFAKSLWHTTQRDTRVIVAHTNVAPVEIASPKLFKPIDRPTEKIASASSLAKEAIHDDVQLVTDTASADPATTPALSPDAEIVKTAAGERTFYKAPVPPARKGLVSAFISRKTGKLYVRYANEPLFETPIEIKDRDHPIGTHVFTAMAVRDGGKEMKWNVFSIPTHAATEPEARKKSSRKVADISEKTVIPAEPQTAASALERVDIPKDAAERLTISDYGISEETGEGTDFVILTR
jgi:hypothetical protein